MEKILIITDDKKSSFNQVEALINRLKIFNKVRFEHLVLKRNFVHKFPNYLIYLYLIFRNNYFEIYDKFDLLISCGRISAPYSLILKKKYGCKNIHILDPYLFRSKFDLIFLPSHDLLRVKMLPNIVETTGTLSNKKKISKRDINKFQTKISSKNIVSCFIGGNGKSSKFSLNNINNIISKINKISSKFKVVYCFSRRTDEYLREIVIKNKKNNHLFFDYKDDNPYWFLIEKSKYFIVTEDSVSMISDAISTGKPVYTLEVNSLKGKIKLFIKNLKEKGIIKPFNGDLKNWKYKPVNDNLNITKIHNVLF